ncbi:hypothetical protein GCM10027258_31120 [Amycolatopsis stemonae]
MDAGTVLRVLEAVSPAEVWLAGGWGIDALLGRQTREHRDLDLLHRLEQEPEVLEALAALGYRETGDLRPVRFVLSDGSTELDLHPLVFAEDGSARQAAPDGTFPYPADCFVTGRVDDYEPKPHDVADMRALKETFGVDTWF